MSTAKAFAPAVLSIWYSENGGRKHHEEQGKIYRDLSPDGIKAGKIIYLADMTEAKVMRRFGAYGIAKQVLDAFAQSDLKVRIIYRRKDLGQYYITTPTTFKTKGIPLHTGFHDQFFLPFSQFEFVKRDVEYEPKNLPVMDVDAWVKTTRNTGVATMAEYQNSMLRLKELWNQKMSAYST
jgi:hypothetical protein